MKTIAIDEEGYFVLQNGIRLTDENVGSNMLNNISMDEFGVTWLNYNGEKYIVEPFDKPYVAAQVHHLRNQWKIQLPYQVHVAFDPHSLSLDSWDRFHGMTDNQVPFVLSRKAQAELFNLASDFSDDSIKLGNETIQTHDYYITSESTNDKMFWTERYNENPSPPWNLDKVHPELVTTLPQLKLMKQKILVPGCGFGHDAAYLAEQGHIVDAIDFSQNAIDEAEKRYGHIKNLSFRCEDFFNLSDDYLESYDIIFEHTFFCALTPNKRKEIIKIWKRCLREKGHLLGIFFVMPKRTGPPFGSSEWELRSLLEKNFQFLYWTRLKFSPGWRKGTELLLYLQKKS